MEEDPTFTVGGIVNWSKPSVKKNPQIKRKINKSKDIPLLAICSKDLIAYSKCTHSLIVFAALSTLAGDFFKKKSKINHGILFSCK